MIDKFAELLGLDVWDWIAVIVSFCSFVIAVMSYVIARSTLKSQRQTEKNTMPIITKERQYEVFKSIENQILSNYIYALAIILIMDDESSGYSYSPLKLLYSKINTSEIHLELFYDTKSYDSMMSNLSFQSPYMHLYKFRSSLESYNQTLTIIGEHTMNPQIDNKIIMREVDDFVLDKSLELLCDLSDCVFNLYNKKADIRNGIVNDLIIFYKEKFDILKINYLDNFLYEDEIDMLRKHYINKKKWVALFDKYDFKKYDTNLEQLIDVLINAAVHLSSKEVNEGYNFKK